MRVTPRKCVPLANACTQIYTGSKRTSGRNHHVRTPFPVWRKHYICLNLWGPCLKWSLKSRSPQHDSEWQQSQRICGSLSKYIGLSSYRIYAIPSPFSHQGHHTNELCYQHQTYCDWMFYCIVVEEIKFFFNLLIQSKVLFYGSNKLFWNRLDMQKRDGALRLKIHEILQFNVGYKRRHPYIVKCKGRSQRIEGFAGREISEK